MKEITTEDIDVEFLKECADENGHCVLKNDVTFAIGYKSGYQAALSAVPAQEPKGRNQHGLDARYFHGKLSLILRDIENYKPEEMYRELSRLADVLSTLPAPTMSQFANKADYEAAIAQQPAQEPVKQEPCKTCGGKGWFYKRDGESYECDACFDQQPAQEPVKAIPIGFDYLDSGQLVATYAVPVRDKGHPNLYTAPPAQKPVKPTEQQILAAAEKAGLWPNTVYTWLPAFHRYHAELAKLNQEPVKQVSWLPIETAPKGKKIIVSYKNACGKDRTVFAKYIEKFTEESSCDSEMDEYDEKTDTYYLKEGWVELIDNWDEFSSVYFDSKNVVTGWMPAPPVKEVTE